MPRKPGSEPIYAIAEQFRQRCLKQGNSLLWPNVRCWTSNDLDRLATLFGEHDETPRSFIEKWRHQLQAAPKDYYRIAADALAVYFLFPSNAGRESKLQAVQEIVSWGPLETPDLSELDSAFRLDIGNPGVPYTRKRPAQICFFLKFAAEIQRRSVDPYDQQSVQRLSHELRREIPYSTSAHHVLLHLLFPDYYERIASSKQKKEILQVFADDAGDTSDRDAALVRVREALANRLGRSTVDFYDPDIEPMWRTVPPTSNHQHIADPNIATGDDSLVELDEEIEELVEQEDTRPAQSTVSELALATNIDITELDKIIGLLTTKKQLIMEGPPGSGKTFIAEKLARFLTGNPLSGGVNSRFELMQFHQSYGYEDFVEGIRPKTTSAGNISYEVVSGAFKQLCANATKSKETYVIVIDEINRGNLSRIFGELLLLLEYRGTYTVKLPYSREQFTIPPNVILIGTMNTTDRSLAQIDYALRRRFYFHRLLPVVNGTAPVLQAWLKSAENIDDPSAVLALFVNLNTRLTSTLGEHFQVGHSYFMNPGIGNDAGRRQIWRHAVMPLLEEYFFNRRDVAVLKQFALDELWSKPITIGASAG